MKVAICFEYFFFVECQEKRKQNCEKEKNKVGMSGSLVDQCFSMKCTYHTDLTIEFTELFTEGAACSAS